VGTDASSGVPGEVQARLTALAETARENATVVLPPLLILGTCERVGSNWVSDTLRPVAGQHNEPFRQQIGADNPWSAANPLFSSTNVAATSATGLLGRHWLVSFAVAKYRPHRQVVKETSLLFALPALLALLPGAPVLVLSRSPLGVASSFTRGELFARWCYRSRYQQMITMTRRGDSIARRFPTLPGTPPAVAPRYVRRGRLEVRNVLVSNAEYARFLNALSQAGLPNSHHGTHLLACEMPHERGGRLHQDQGTGAWAVSPGYEDYPVYWVTWIGAAAFAARNGARLPTRAELTGLASGAATTGNAGYRSGDATPVTEPGAHRTKIHHLLGNLQTWCCDGPDERTGGPAARWLHGIAWNTPATQQAAQQPRCRHILGCSRGVGIRLVRDGGQQAVATDELACRLTAWIGRLADRSRPLAEIDEELIRALDASQTDSGLGSHVAAGSGETRHG
jgi:Sulfatase-modifying factor enzyme 1